MMMKKIMLAVSALAVSVAFAGVRQIAAYAGQEGVTYYQFTHYEATNTGDYHDTRHTDQNWLEAQLITLTVPGEMDVWLSRKADNFFGDYVYALDGNDFDMDAEKYGAWQLNGDKEWIGTGATSAVTYTHISNSAVERDWEAYYLGHFSGGEQIGIWLTTIPEDGSEEVDTQQYVQDGDHDTVLASRGDAYGDNAGNVVINFGIQPNPSDILTRHGHEWVAVGVEGGVYDGGQPAGAPLPGVWATLALVGGLMGAKKMKKSKK